MKEFDKPTLTSVTYIITHEGMKTLSYYLGGKRIYIPKDMPPGHPLAVAIGLKAAQDLSKAFGGQTFDVPSKSGRKVSVMMMREEGLSVSQIAHKLRCSRTYVKDTLSEGEHHQLEMF